LVFFYTHLEKAREANEENQKLRDQFKTELQALNKLIPLDYMGAAEYEWGAVAKCLSEICLRRKSMRPFSTMVSGKYELFSFYPEAKKSKALINAKEMSETLVGWCVNGQEEALRYFLESEAVGDHHCHLKEVTQIQAGCFGRLTHKSDQVEKNGITGWLDLMNYWFVSIDPLQAGLLARMLGINLK
jgi:hypothetical protein